MPRRFAVALSYPSVHVKYVRRVAERLGDVLGRERVFFDEWYRSEILGVDSDLKLRRIYREDAELLVPFLSEKYDTMWCEIEWSTIRAVLAARRSEDAVLPVHMDGARIEGWEDVDIGIRRRRRPATQVADEILAYHSARGHERRRGGANDALRPGPNGEAEQPDVQRCPTGERAEEKLRKLQRLEKYLREEVIIRAQLRIIDPIIQDLDDEDDC